ncbi:MAG: sigma-70 family RNA polymerase sigma factor [Candidatus Doudnabacteria bacterium]|nr:sigma-70 family RNA polymerase sigma factor [Candidatus Doudnabacteria bacterium]
MSDTTGESAPVDFASIVNQNIDGLYNFAAYMVSDKEEAKDIVQTTFFAMFKNFSKLDQSKPLKPWLYKVARNNCLDYLRKKKALNFSELKDELEVPETDPLLEEQMNSSLAIDQFRTQLDSLPTVVKEIMLLKYFEDFTFEQISEQLDTPLNTVKSHFYRGKAKLYQITKDQHGHN